MSLLAGYLWPLSLVIGLPLIIHLLTRRPPRPMIFAPIGLLRRALKRQERRLRLRRWVLLALRTAWVACVALAAMQPQWGRPAEVASGDLGALALLLDGSGSMATKGADGQTFFARALARGQQQANQRPVGVYLCAASGLKRLQPEPSSGVDIRSVVGDYQPLGPVDLGACSTAVKGEKQVLSDGWSPLPEGLNVVRVAKPGEGRNWGLGAVRLSRRGGRSYRLHIEVVGRPGRRRLQAFLEGKKRAATMVSLPASGRAVATISLGLDPGFYALTLQLPADDRSDDNRRVIGLEASGATRVLAINGDARDTAYADELFYVDQASRALDHHDPFRLEVVAAGEEHQAPLQDSDVVLLANTASLDPSFVQALPSYVRAGGGLLISAGSNTDVRQLNSQIGGWFPVPLRSRWASKDAEGKASKKTALGVTSPDAKWLKALGLSAGGGLLRTRVWQGLHVESGGYVPWRLSDGRALLVEAELGEGRAALLTTTIDRDHADLAIRPGFVPFLRALLRRLAGDRASQVSPSVVPGVAWRHDILGQDLTFRRQGGGLARAKRDESGLHFKPPALGLWRNASAKMTVELRTDPSESLPQEASDKGAKQRQAAAATGRQEDPLWPALLIAALVFLLAESALLLADHRARTA